MRLDLLLVSNRHILYQLVQELFCSYSHHERNRQESVVDGGEMGGDPVVQPQPEAWKHDEHQTLNIEVHLAMSATSRIR